MPKNHLSINKYIFFIFITLTACGGADSELSNKATSPSPHKGTLTQINGALIQLGDEEAAKHCKNNFCEPNYIYSINFGSRKPPPPTIDPNPAPLPPPIPGQPGPNQPKDPGALPNSGTEVFDYSRSLLKIRDAWNITQGDPNIIVAIIDTGADVLNHDLRNNIWTNEAELNGELGVDDDGNGYIDDIYGYDFVKNKGNAVDDNKHGTHCAGIVGAELNSYGSVGVAPQVKIMPIKFLSSTGTGSAQNAVKAFRYAIDNGAHIISNSWSGSGASTFLNEIIQEAVSKGIYVVAAASNENNNNDSAPMYPANYPNVISVGSTDSRDKKSSFSNYGRNTVHIAAPGSDIYSTLLNGEYGKLSGTSMAAPQVAGALALALSLDHTLTTTEMKTRLCQTSKKILLDKFQCGRMDVKAFVDSVLH